MFDAIAKPFGWLLMQLYELFGNYGLAIIFFALVIKVILLPFQMKSKRGTMMTTRLQPKMKELEKKHGANKAKYNEEVAKLYKEENVNPASGCLWSFLPIPIMIALYQVIRQPLTIMMGVAAELLQEGGAITAQLDKLGFTSTVSSYYVQIAQSQFITANFDKFSYISEQLRKIDFNFLGLDLGRQPQWNFFWNTDWSDSSVWLPGLFLFLIPIISGGVQFISSKISQKMNPAPAGQAGSMQTMMLMMPLVSVYIAYITPAALGVYWTVGTILQMAQDIWLTKRYTRILDAEDAVRSEERKKKEAELEAKRIETERKKAENATVRNPNTSKRKRQITEKQEQIEKSVEWEKKKMPPKESEPSRVGDRRYARGRAYDPDRYSKSQTEGDIETEENAENSSESPEENFALPEDGLADTENTDTSATDGDTVSAEDISAEDVVAEDGKEEP